MVTNLLAALFFTTQIGGDVTRFEVLPSVTDPKIDRFDSPHSIFIETDEKTRKNILLLFLTGTNGKTLGMDSFCVLAAKEGYQVINLMYPDDIAATAVRNSADRNAFTEFRLEIIEGHSQSTAIRIGRDNSIENRLIKLLKYLEAARPNEHWGRYLTKDEQPDWPHIAVSGLSQGAGHAALIATRHRVARAVLFGGPKDYDRQTNMPASWYKNPPATPLRYIFTFNHEQDRQGCDFKEQLENCHAMGLDALGGPANVDEIAPPFRNSHILTTNYPGTRVESVRAHTSVVQDRSTPRTADGDPLFLPVWHYMLTAG